MANSTCVGCGKPFTEVERSREHILPEWLAREVEQPDLSLKQYRHEARCAAGLIEGYFQEQRRRISLQLRLRGGGRSHERTCLCLKSLLTGKNTVTFYQIADRGWRR